MGELVTAGLGGAGGSMSLVVVVMVVAMVVGMVVYLIFEHRSPSCDPSIVLSLLMMEEVGRAGGVVLSVWFVRWGWRAR